MRKQLFFLFVLISSCKVGDIKYRETESDSPIGLTPNTTLNYSLPTQQTKTTSRISYKVFIDNSYSMNGYFKGQTEFLSTTNRLLTQLSIFADDQRSSCGLYSFNNDVNFCGSTNDTRIDHYLKKVSSFFASDKRGNRGVTDLKDILTAVFDSLNHNTVSIVITDGIASPGLKGQDAETYLDIMENSLYRSVYRKLSNTGFATAIIKCNSNFNGIYINQNNKGVQYDGASRPYYIIAAGSEKAVKELQQIFKNSPEMKGYEASYFLAGSKPMKIRSKVLLTTDYDLAGDAKDMKIRSNASSNNLRLRLLLDLKNVPVQEQYLLDPDNYDIYPAAEQLTILPISNPDDPANKGYTHKLVVVTQNRNVDHNIRISLKYDLPQWVYDSSCESDLNLSAKGAENKTFGFLSMVRGVESGYKEKGLLENYFSVNVKVFN